MRSATRIGASIAVEHDLAVGQSRERPRRSTSSRRTDRLPFGALRIGQLDQLLQRRLRDGDRRLAVALGRRCHWPPATRVLAQLDEQVGHLLQRADPVLQRLSRGRGRWRHRSSAGRSDWPAQRPGRRRRGRRSASSKVWPVAISRLSRLTFCCCAKHVVERAEQELVGADPHRHAYAVNRGQQALEQASGRWR